MCADASKEMLLLCVVVFIVYATIGNTVAKSINVETTRTELTGVQHLKLLRSRLKECGKLQNETTWNCLKESSLRTFEEVLAARVINIWHGIRFVRLERAQELRGNMVAGNNEAKGFADAYRRKDMQHLTWFDRLAMSLAKSLTTYMLQINLKEFTNAFVNVMEAKGEMPLQDTDPIGTARHRRQRFNMIITMMFGVTALGAVLVPLGFQLLSVVSGKALLLAKMALLLASINGLKRVASSGVHYGLYQVPGEHFGGGYYDRGDLHHPRNVPSVAVAPAMELALQK